MTPAIAEKRPQSDGISAIGRIAGYSRRMRRTAILAALILLVLAATAVAGPGESDNGGIKGRVIDLTCYGPCAVGSNPRPFEGEADVVVSVPGTGQEVARTTVSKSRYRLAVKPGVYRVRAIAYPMQDSLCWYGEPRRVRVDPGELERRRLTVENVCVQ